MKNKILAACGNDCAACPRYVPPPYEKTQEQLRRTAELWYQIGYRDHVVTNEEISCTGCKTDNWCRYQVVSCVAQQGLETCGGCNRYPCRNIRECFAVTGSFIPACRAACTPEEFEIFRTAFFEKEKNLSSPGAQEKNSGLTELF